MRYLLIILPLLVLLGCSKVSKESYEQIYVGMSYSAVVEILGKPNACEDVESVKSCVWGNVSKNIKVRFLNERAVLISELGVL
ncbi:MAG: DUF3862 domain-containing protein [Campylobacteraceae bacterium]|nr:DUF3862 domain-containing protein [Campylobacteraceae bacterium]